MPLVLPLSEGLGLSLAAGARLVFVAKLKRPTKQFHGAFEFPRIFRLQQLPLFKPSVRGYEPGVLRPGVRVDRKETI
jgi:hypothetical protein